MIVGLEMNTNIVNTKKYVTMMMLICIKQRLSSI